MTKKKKAINTGVDQMPSHPAQPQIEMQDPKLAVEGDVLSEVADVFGEAIEEENEALDTFFAEMQALQQELETTRNQANEYLDGWQRSRAEFANYKKRVEREQAQVYQNAAGSVIKRFLDVLDDLDRALNNRPQGGDGAAWASGIELIYRKLLSVLESEGVKQMKIEGQYFDPNQHEAISLEVSPDHESGQIISVVRPGYTIGERVLRTAIVRVAQ